MDPCPTLIHCYLCVSDLPGAIQGCTVNGWERTRDLLISCPSLQPERFERHGSVGRDGRLLYHGYRCARASALKTVPSHNDVDTVRIGLFNSRSVMGKSAIIQQSIGDNELSIAALTETWHDDAASPDLIACAPAGWKFRWKVAFEDIRAVDTD